MMGNGVEAQSISAGHRKHQNKFDFLQSCQGNLDLVSVMSVNVPGNTFSLRLFFACMGCKNRFERDGLAVCSAIGRADSLECSICKT